MRRRFVWSLALSVIFLNGSEAIAVPDKETLLIINPGEGNPRNSEGDIIDLQDGRLYLVYSRFTGSSSDQGAADLAKRVSGDNGKTWSGDSIVVPNPGGLNVMCVSLLRLQSGEIALFYARKKSHVDCRPMMRISTDEAKTWSEPTMCIPDKMGYYVLNNGRATQLSSGRLILPVAWHRSPGGEPDWQGVVMCYLSDDKGKTWRRSKDSFKGYSPAGQRISVQEPGVVELKDGRLMMYCRTDASCQYVSHSADGGETWSKLVPSTLMSPLSPASIERIPWTGDLLCVWNDHSGTHPYPRKHSRWRGRTPLCAAISKDQGQTWGRSRIIESKSDGCYCYTSITFQKDRAILSSCAGDSKIGGLNCLKVQALSKDWLLNPPVVYKQKTGHH